jgi:fatty aldehyde-generating acyl-ACP reductase
MCPVGKPERDDVLVIDGGMAELPGAEPDSHFNFGLSPGMGFACLAETVLLALEGRYESYSLDKEV